jgi:L-alanine-DL-glutamate epimerase-like enolase superfamily enzyme
VPKIRSIDVTIVEVPMREPLATSTHTYDVAGYVIVRLRLDDGAEGYGEARESLQITGETRESIAAAVRTTFAPSLIGRDATDFEGAHRAMNMAATGNTAAKSAIDMALFDAAGRSAGLPVSTLLGGAPRGPLASSKAISVGATAAMVDQARAFAGAGFRTLKIKTGIDEAAELAAIAAIREAVGPDVHLKLDANQAWNLPDATRFLNKAARYNIQMIEQPLPAFDYRGSAELRRRVPMPVMLDEGVRSAEDAFKAIEANACDYINIKLVKTGGLYPASKLVAVAESAGVPCQIGTLDTTIGSAAAVHLVHARPAIRFAEINGPSRVSFDLASGFVLAQGRADITPGPGLGVTIDRSRLRFDQEKAPGATRAEERVS